MKPVYPVSLRVEGKCCVVMGGGAVAERKVEALLQAGAQVRVIAPEVTPGIARLAREGQVEWRRRGASEADVEDALLVIAATDDRDLNARIAASLLSCLQPELFEATGLLRSAWLMRMSNVTEDAQGMIDELVAIEEPASAVASVGTPRSGRLRRFGK